MIDGVAKKIFENANKRAHLHHWHSHSKCHRPGSCVTSLVNIEVCTDPFWDDSSIAVVFGQLQRQQRHHRHGHGVVGLPFRDPATSQNVGLQVWLPALPDLQILCSYCDSFGCSIIADDRGTQKALHFMKAMALICHLTWKNHFELRDVTVLSLYQQEIFPISLHENLAGPQLYFKLSRFQLPGVDYCTFPLSISRSEFFWKS